MSYKGTPMKDMYHGESPWEFHTLPVLVSSYHAILFQLNPSLKHPPEPYAGTLKCHWEEGYVRMPYSPKNVFPSKDDNGRDILISRWELIQKTLLQDIESSRAFEAAVNAYNNRLPKFHALHYLFEEILDQTETEDFFCNLLPKIINLAIQLPDIVPGSIPLLKVDHCKSISISQQQIACLLANAFLCTFSGRKSMANTFPNINFVSLFSTNAKNESVIEKIKCVIHYFRRVLDKMPCGVVTFERQHINRPNCPRWDKVDNNLGNVRLHVDSNGTIEDNGLGLLQVDFANKFLGGGVLGYGCVQEEIRFVICPELIITRLFTEKLSPCEAIIITGVERFSKYSGYGDAFQWDGDFIDETPFDDYGRRRTNITAIDATHFSKSMEQFNSGAILRELNKAYCGFHSRAAGTLSAVATGNWGCGAFGGDPHLKFLIQLMAASAARRDLVYFTFGSDSLRDEIYNMHTFLATNQVTITQLWRLMCKFIGANLRAEKFLPFIQQAYFDTKKQPTIQAAFSQLHSIAQQNTLTKDKIVTQQQQPSTSTSSFINTNSNSYKKETNSTPGRNNSRKNLQTNSTSNNNEIDWSDDDLFVSVDDVLATVGKETNVSPQVQKRKRKTSNSTDLLALIDKIDGHQITNTASSTSNSDNSSLGFLSCVDEYVKQRPKVDLNSSKTDKDKLTVIDIEKDDKLIEEIMTDDEEEMDVEDVLESLEQDANKSKSNNSFKNAGTPKRKITDYFKKS